jgi:hypothetical protein
MKVKARFSVATAETESTHKFLLLLALMLDLLLLDHLLNLLLVVPERVY